MIAKFARGLIVALLFGLVALGGTGVGAQDEDSSDPSDPALIVYACANGFNVKNICVIDETGNNEQKITDTIYSSRESYDPSVNIHDQIAHTCELENDSRDICVMNSDGSGRVQRSVSSPYVYNYTPLINDEGLIIHRCTSDFSSSNLCVIEPGTNVSKQIPLPSGRTGSGGMDLDNKRRILYGCEINFAQRDICVINADGTGFREITESELFSGKNFVNPRMNNQSQGIFDCQSPDLGVGICLVNLDSKDPFELIVKSTPELQVSGAFINDAGQLAFSCRQEDTFEREICIYTIGSNSPAKIITDPGDGIDHRVLSLTRNGVIVNECSSSAIAATDYMCVINFDGTGSQTLIDLFNTERNDRPQINDAGQTFFRCLSSGAVFNVCKIDEPGAPVENITERLDIDASQFDFSDYDINDLGDVLLECTFSRNNRSVCLVALESGTFESLNEREQFQGMDLFSPSINNSGLAVFRCGQEGGDDALCVASIDGTRNEILDLSENFERLLGPSINESDQIVFRCERHDSFYSEVCVIDLHDNNSVHILTQAEENEDNIFAFPNINIAGRVVHECNNFFDNEDLLSDVCSVNADGSGFINHSANGSRTRLDVFDLLSINDANMVVYPCPNIETNALDICVSTPSSVDGTVSEERIVGEWTLRQPWINNRNELVYQCLDLEGNRNICYHNLETGETHQLTFLSEKGEVSDIASQ